MKTNGMRPLVATARPKEAGAALLTILLLVAVMAIAAAAMAGRVGLASHLTASSNGAARARQALMAAEALATTRVAADGARLLARGTAAQDYRMADGTHLTLRLADGGNCFNLNALVADPMVSPNLQRPIAIAQFVELAAAAGVARPRAQALAFAAADWIDGDGIAAAGGAAEAAGKSGETPPNRALTSADALADLPMLDMGDWARLRPQLCALPTHDMPSINPNHLTVEDAPLLHMLLAGGDGVSADAAVRALLTGARRYGRVEDFWAAAQAAGLHARAGAAGQIRLGTRYYRLDASASVPGDNVPTRWQSLIDAGDGQSRPRPIGRSIGIFVGTQRVLPTGSDGGTHG